MRAVICVLVIFFLTQPVLGQDGFIGQSPALAFWTVGDKEEVVIVLHGGPAAGHQYLRPEWDNLSNVAKVVYYDQRGCGKSEKAESYCWEEHVSDLRKVVTAFCKGKKVILAGSSWGCVLALLYARQFPADVKALILSGTFPWPGEGFKLQDCSSYLPDYSAFYQRGLDTNTKYLSLKYGYITNAPVTLDSAGAQKMMEDKLCEFPFLPRVGTSLSLKYAPVLQTLQSVDVPVLAFESKTVCDEPHLPKDGAAQFKILPKVQFYSIEGACHDPWLTHTYLFFTKTKEFIRDLQ